MLFELCDDLSSFRIPYGCDYVSCGNDACSIRTPRYRVDGTVVVTKLQLEFATKCIQDKRITHVSRNDKLIAARTKLDFRELAVFVISHDEDFVRNL